MTLVLTRDEYGIDRDPQGNFVSQFTLEAMAYEAGLFYGQEPKYADCPSDRLPQPIVAAFFDLGEAVLLKAKLGWHRARYGWSAYGGLSIREEVEQHKKERRAPRPYRTEADPRYVPPIIHTSASAPAPATAPAEAAAAKKRASGPAYNGPDLRPRVHVDPEPIVLSKKNLAKLSKEARAMLKECLPPEAYLDKTFGEVARALPFRSLSSEWQTQTLITMLDFELSIGVEFASFGN